MPIIKLYNLRKDYIYDGSYKIYSNKEEKISLIISGIGLKKINKAVSILNNYYKDNNSIWVNIGLAGHKYLKEGGIFEIKKAIIKNGKYAFFTNIFLHNIKTHTLCSVKSEERTYSEDYLYDMEGYWFLKALNKITNKDNIFIFKIISDNSFFKPKSYKKFAIEKVSSNAKKIRNLLIKYRFIQENHRNEVENILTIIKQKYHLTFYNKKKIEKLLVQLLVIKNREFLRNEIVNSTSLNNLIQILQYQLKNFIFKI